MSRAGAPGSGVAARPVCWSILAFEDIAGSGRVGKGRRRRDHPRKPRAKRRRPRRRTGDAAAIRQAFALQHCAKQRREHPESPGEPHGIHGTAPGLQGVFDAGPVGGYRLGDEPRRHGLALPQDGENDPTDGKGPAAGALGQSGQRDEHDDDAPQCLKVPSCKLHVRASLLPADILRRVVEVSMEFGRNSWKWLILLEVDVESIHVNH
jgi:hypothetical protein